MFSPVSLTILLRPLWLVLLVLLSLMMWSDSTILLETNGIDASIKKRKVTHTRCAYEIAMLPWNTSLSSIFNEPQYYQFLIYIDYLYLAKDWGGYSDDIFILSKQNICFLSNILLLKVCLRWTSFHCWMMVTKTSTLYFISKEKHLFFVYKNIQSFL